MAEVSPAQSAVSTTQAKRIVGRVKSGIANVRAINREAALDSARSIFAMVGVGSVLAYMGTMPPYLVPLALLMLAGAWYADYLRHF